MSPLTLLVAHMPVVITGRVTQVWQGPLSFWFKGACQGLREVARSSFIAHACSRAGGWGTSLLLLALRCHCPCNKPRWPSVVIIRWWFRSTPCPPQCPTSFQLFRVNHLPAAVSESVSIFAGSLSSCSSFFRSVSPTSVLKKPPAVGIKQGSLLCPSPPVPGCGVGVAMGCSPQRETGGCRSSSRGIFPPRESDNQSSFWVIREAGTLCQGGHYFFSDTAQSDLIWTKHISLLMWLWPRSPWISQPCHGSLRSFGSFPPSWSLFAPELPLCPGCSGLCHPGATGSALI